MAFPVVSKTYVEKINKVVSLFSKYHPGIVFSTETSLDILKAKKDAYDLAIDVRNAAAIAFNNSILVVNSTEAELSKAESSFLVQAGERFTKDSDEYVWAGGTRQSEANEKRKATLEENQRLAKQRLEEENVRIKAEKDRFEAEMIALKAEVERLKAERDAIK